MKIIKTILFIVAVLLYKLSLGQDIHFSQFYDAPLNANPAMAGIQRNDYRATIGQRTQWRSVTVPYTTITASFDAKYLTLKRDFFFGIGALVNTDRAGDAGFGRQSVGVPVALHRFLTADSLTTISLGTMVGITGLSYDFSKLIFDNSFSGDTYKPDLPTMVSIPYDKKMSFDFSMGIVFNKEFGVGKEISLGAAAYHVNNSGSSFFDDDIQLLPPKFSLQFKGCWPVSDLLFVQPVLFVAQQSVFREIMAGSLLSYRNGNSTLSDLSLGILVRPGDAVISSLSFEYKSMKVGLAYDFNLSGLRKASKGMGGAELMLQYNIRKARKIIPAYHSCPVYF